MSEERGPGSAGWRPGELRERIPPVPWGGQVPARPLALPPGTAHLPAAIIRGSPRSHPACLFSCHAPASLLARSWDEFPLSALPARGVRDGFFSPQQVRRLHNILFPQDTSFWEGNYGSDLIRVCGMRSPTFGELRQPGPSGCARSSAHPHPAEETRNYPLAKLPGAKPGVDEAEKSPSGAEPRHRDPAVGLPRGNHLPTIPPCP